VTGGIPAVEARINMLATASGGLREPLPTGTRSLLAGFPALEGPGDVQIGAVIEVSDGGLLTPGTKDVRVRLRFWADDAAIYATPGATFTLWYGRVVGAGVVERVIDDTAGVVS
jgi:hypothetical protein